MPYSYNFLDEMIYNRIRQELIKEANFDIAKHIRKYARKTQGMYFLMSAISELFREI